MESIGDRLKSAREAKKLSVRDVARETNISPAYIEALETEDFDHFPGETYIVGFLRNYAEYLKLDADEIIQSYKGYIIGESATPLEELTRPARPAFSLDIVSMFQNNRKIFYAAGGLVVLIILLLLIRAISTDVNIEGDDSISNIKSEYADKQHADGIENIHNLKLSDDGGMVLVFQKEAVQFMVDTKEVLFIARDVKSDSVMIEILPGKVNEKLEIDKPKTVTLPEVPRKITFTLKALTENRAKIQVSIEKKTGDEPTAAEATTSPEPAANVDTTRVVAQNEKNLKIVFDAEFTGKTYVDIYLDGTKKSQSFYVAGDKMRWEAAQSIQIKIGNAGGIKARINGKEYKFGLPGQVVNKVIKWQRDPNNPTAFIIVLKDW